MNASYQLQELDIMLCAPRRLWLAAAVLAACLLSMSPVWAGGDHYNLRIEPTSLTSTDQFNVVVDGDGCDVFSGTPSDRLVQRSGDVIRVIVTHGRLFNCTEIPGSHSWLIGPFPAGTYQVQLLAYVNSPDPEAAVELTPAIGISIAPGTTTPAVVPALSYSAGLGLAVFLVFVGFSVLTRHRS